MWTPKRIVLLVVGFGLFGAGYAAYAFCFGGIDGLPPLQESYLLALKPGDEPFTRLNVTKVEEKLYQAFGLECPESKSLIKLEMRGGMVLAANDYNFQDGRLCLKPFSLAMFGKPKNDGRGVEINTVRSKVAYLTFDRPITGLNPNEINGRRIVGAELIGDIQVVNNRRTAQRDDDIDLYIATGPLYYQESNHLVWTHDAVRVTDRHPRLSPPNVISGKGMELELLAESQPAAPGRKPRGESITGVKRISLLSGVDMHLYVDGRSGFLGGPHDDTARPPAPAAARAAPPAPSEETSQIIINTPGRFDYLFLKDYDTAHFQAAPANAAAAGRAPRHVTVTRHNERLNQDDHLVCSERLDLKLVRKDAKPAGGKEPEKKPAGDERSPDQGIEIETAHAFGEEVVITSDAEKLVAYGNDLHFDAKASLTILKGNPGMRAEKEDNVIFARELQIQDQKLPNADRTFQKAVALGPGRIDMKDPKNPAKILQQAFWNDKLVSTKDDRPLAPKETPKDLLILTGVARFVDDERKQSMQGDTVKVWLHPAGEKTATVERATPAPSAGQQQGARTEHLEAVGNVTASSSELNVHDTGRLVVWFKDAPRDTLPTVQELEAKGAPAKPPAQGRLLPALPGDPAPPPQNPPPSPLPPGLPAHQASKPAVAANVLPNPDAVGKPPAKTEPPPPRPVDLSARSIEATVLRSESKTALEKLWTEGAVHVRQEPAKPGEQGMEIKGETLLMLYHAAGNFLRVNGSEETPAFLQMDKILILGPEVNIDQADNKVWVRGAGAMRLDSATSLGNKPLEKSVPLTIHWQQEMLVMGRNAEFHGDIQADQDRARMACQSLRVYFDRPISLREGAKSEESPRVQLLMCDKSVFVEDSEYDGDRLVQLQRLTAPAVSENALEAPDDLPRKPNAPGEGNEMHASGPGGKLRIVKPDSTDPLAPPPDPKAPRPPPKPAAKPGEPEPLKLTFLTFEGSMYANSKTNLASFRKNVRVLHMPLGPKDDPNMEVDIDFMVSRLPPGSMYLSCNNLQVWTRTEKGRKYQEMHATDNATVQLPNYWGRAQEIHYDEAKDQIILDGKGGEATLTKIRQPGVEPETLSGSKIIYIRSTGAFQVEKAKSLQGFR